MIKGVDYTGVCVVFICHDGNRNYLFSKRSANCRDEHGCWDQGGGGIEFDDTVDATLRKEVKEEYGADILDYEFLGFRDVHRTHNERNTHWIALDFKVHVPRDQVRNCEPHKFDDLQWFTLDALPKPLHSQTPHFLEKYEGRL